MKALIFMVILLTGTVRGQSIIRPPSNATGISGGKAIFHCQMTLDSFQQMTWDFNDISIYSYQNGNEEYLSKEPHKYLVKRKDGNFTLTVKNLVLEDGGLYTCAFYMSRETAVLIVLGKPSLNPLTSDQVEGETAVYTCEMHFGGPSQGLIAPDHYPYLRMSLKDDCSEVGEKIQVNELMDVDGHYHHLEVYNLTFHQCMDGKQLVCETGTLDPAINESYSTTLNVLYPVHNVSYSPRLEMFEVGSRVTCTAEGNPKPSIEWINEEQGDLRPCHELFISRSMVGLNTWKCIAENTIKGELFENFLEAKFEAVDPYGHANYIPLYLLIGVIALVSGVLLYTCFKRVHYIKRKYMEHMTLRFIVAAAVTVFGNSFPYGWNIGVLNIPQNTIKDFVNASLSDRFAHQPSSVVLETIWAVTVSAYMLAGCGGSLVAVSLADNYGRKKSLLLCHITGLISATLFGLCKMMHSVEMLVIARLVVGFGCGVSSVIVPIYLIEIAHPEIRDMVLVFHQFGKTCGILFSQVIGLHQLLGQESLWPILLALTALPCLVSYIVLPWLPESPKYLYINCGNKDKAEEALNYFQYTKKDVSSEMKELKNKDEKETKNETWPIQKLLKQFRWPFILICSLAICQELSGIRVVYCYSVSIFEETGIPKDMLQYAVLTTGIIIVLTTGISMMTDLGRRYLLLGGMTIMVVSASLITVSLHLQNVYVSIIFMNTFVIGFALELGSIQQSSGAELFKQGPQSPALSVAGILNWFASFIVMLAFPFLQMAAGPNCFIIFIIILVGFGIFFVKKFPETKGKTMEEIYKELGVKWTGHSEAEETLLNRSELNHHSSSAHDQSDDSPKATSSV